MALLKRGELLKRQELLIEKVDLGDDDYVFVREMTGRERDDFEMSMLKEVKDAKGEVDYQRDIRDFRAKLAVNTMCDDQGNPLLDYKDYTRLSQNMGARRLRLIADAASKLNKMEEKDEEELAKNSDAGQAGSSDSPSVEN
jgi:hypothetical protein